jgi:hypothetical protein
MKLAKYFLVVLFILLTGSPGVAAGPTWAKIDTALSAWQGEKNLVLVSTAEAPLETIAVQEVLEQVLLHDFAVRIDAAVAAGGSGLILELRDGKQMSMAILRRASDKAIIAFERHVQASDARPDAPPATAPVQAKPLSSPAVPSAPVVVAEPHPAADLPGPLALPGKPRSVAVIKNATDADLIVVLQSDAGVTRYRMQDHQLQALSEFKTKKKALRALYLESGDPDHDGATELAAVWADDLQGIYTGTDSRLSSTILESRRQGFSAQQGPDAFVRLLNGKGLVQFRGRYSLWHGPVRALQVGGEGWAAGNEPVSWASSNLFDITPLDDAVALQRTAAGQLRLVSLENGQPLPGGTLLYDLGDFEGAPVAVSLETPEYRSGFSKEDMVRETWWHLPPRVTVTSDGTAYTIRRGRSTGLPLIGKPSGRDQLIALHWNGRQVTVAEPFAGVEAFILDFALIENRGSVQAALLLLNQKPDGSGKAYLQIVPFTGHP